MKLVLSIAMAFGLVGNDGKPVVRHAPPNDLHQPMLLVCPGEQVQAGPIGPPSPPSTLPVIPPYNPHWVDVSAKPFSHPEAVNVRIGDRIVVSPGPKAVPDAYSSGGDWSTVWFPWRFEYIQRGTTQGGYVSFGRTPEGCEMNWSIGWERMAMWGFYNLRVAHTEEGVVATYSFRTPPGQSDHHYKDVEPTLELLLIRHPVVREGFRKVLAAVGIEPPPLSPLARAQLLGKHWRADPAAAAKAESLIPGLKSGDWKTREESLRSLIAGGDDVLVYLHHRPKGDLTPDQQVLVGRVTSRRTPLSAADIEEVRADPIWTPKKDDKTP